MSLEHKILAEAAANQENGDGRDPEGNEPRRTPSPTLSQRGNRREDEGSILQQPTSTPSFSNNRNSFHTGPKGVLADYRASNQSQANQQPPSQQLAGLRVDQSILERDEADQLSDEEDSALAHWRSKRLAELRAENGHDSGRKTFGQFREIGINNFENAVLNESAGVKVVLHLFEAHLTTCLVLNLHLSNLSRDFPHIKFLRAQASEIDFAQEQGDVVLPTILVYKSGELVANLVAIDQAWGRHVDYEESDLVNVFMENGVLIARDLEMRNALRQSSDRDDGDDGDDA